MSEKGLKLGSTKDDGITLATCYVKNRVPSYNCIICSSKDADSAGNIEPTSVNAKFELLAIRSISQSTSSVCSEGGC